MAKPKKRVTHWHKLDNTANVFPVMPNRRMSNVFRLTSILYEKVEPQFLQEALDTVLPYFGAFCVRLRHGLFWSYFETNNESATIEEEREAPCRYMNPLESNRYMFRVLYFENRIHLEVFHALTDGTGAMRFLKGITYEYLKLAHKDDFSQSQLSTLYGIDGASNTEDAYIKNYVRRKGKTFKEETAYIVRKGEYRAPDNLGVITALMPVEQIKAIAKQNNASITEYLSALLAYGVYVEYMGVSGSKRPVNLFIPVDLRRIFGNDTNVNFFSNITVGIRFSAAPKSFEQVLDEVKAIFKEQLKREFFEQKLSFTVRSETNIFTRIIPLPVKNSILRIVYEHSNHGATMTFSNLGIQDIVEEFKQYIDGFRFILYASDNDPVKFGAVSAKGVLTLTYSTYLEGFSLAKYVVRELTRQGVCIEVESNGDTDETL